MSKNIWHTKDETPSKESRVFWVSGNIVYGGRFDAYYKCFCGPASQFVDLKKVSFWGYIDDVLSFETENKDLSDKIGKLETELDRTRKALENASESVLAFRKRTDIAMCALAEINNQHPDGCNKWWYVGVARKALEQIKALEQKDVK